MHQNASVAPVDHVMPDFEDACPLEYKGPQSREVMVQALNTVDFGYRVIAIRPNNMLSPYFEGDMEAIMKAVNKFHGIIIPKTTGPEYVCDLAKMLDEMEGKYGWETRVGIEPLIETPGAVLKAYDIATASNRVVGLIFGFADFTAEMGLDQDLLADGGQSGIYDHARAQVTMAAKAAGVHAIDNAYLRIWKKDAAQDEIEKLQRDLRSKNESSAKLGMDGTWVIHPQQADIANECYTPSQKRIDDARDRLVYYHQNGGGSLFYPVSGTMIDEATIKADLQTVAKGSRAGLIGQDFVDEMAEKSSSITGYDITAGRRSR